MDITNEKRHNEHLVKHIRATSSKCSSSLADQEYRARIKELERLVEFSPLLKLRVSDPLNSTR